MGIAQDIKKLQDQMKVVMDLLRHPTKQASTVLYLVETIQNLEGINFDLSTRWNTAVNYLQNKQLVEEYNAWTTELNKLPSPELKKLFMMQPIDGPKQPPVTPDLCNEQNPFREGVVCLDANGHDGDEHLGVDQDGKMWKWTKDEDLGEADPTPEAPTNQPDSSQEEPPELSEDFPETPEEPEEPEEEPEEELPEH